MFQFKAWISFLALSWVLCQPLKASNEIELFNESRELFIGVATHDAAGFSNESWGDLLRAIREQSRKEPGLSDYGFGHWIGIPYQTVINLIVRTSTPTTRQKLLIYRAVVLLAKSEGAIDRFFQSASVRAALSHTRLNTWETPHFTRPSFQLALTEVPFMGDGNLALPGHFFVRPETKSLRDDRSPRPGEERNQDWTEAQFIERIAEQTLLLNTYFELSQSTLSSFLDVLPTYSKIIDVRTFRSMVMVITKRKMHLTFSNRHLALTLEEETLLREEIHRRQNPPTKERQIQLTIAKLIRSLIIDCPLYPPKSSAELSSVERQGNLLRALLASGQSMDTLVEVLQNARGQSPKSTDPVLRPDRESVFLLLPQEETALRALLARVSAPQLDTPHGICGEFMDAGAGI